MQTRRPGLHGRAGNRPDGEVDDLIRFMLQSRRGLAKYEGEIRRLVRRARDGDGDARRELWRRWRCRIVSTEVNGHEGH